MLENNAVEGVLRTLGLSRGQALSAVDCLEYVPAVEAPSHGRLDQLRVTLGQKRFRFRCASDGEEIAVDTDDIKPCHMEKHGVMRLRNLSHASEFRGIQFSTLREVSAAMTPNGTVIGLALEFGEGCLVVCNWGDELKVYHSVPLALFAAEAIRLRLI